MPNITLTPESLILIAGAILSLVFSYVPGLNTAYAKLSTEVKKLIMLGLLLVVTIGLTVLSCAKVIPVGGVVCTQDGFVQIAWIFILAIVANQGTFSISPKTKAVKRLMSRLSK